MPAATSGDQSLHCWLLLGCFFYSLDLKPFRSIWGFILLRCATYRFVESKNYHLNSQEYSQAKPLIVGACFSCLFWLTEDLLSIWVWRDVISLFDFPSQIFHQLHTEGKLLSEKIELYLILGFPALISGQVAGNCM